jgi:hypothetical protein
MGMTVAPIIEVGEFVLPGIDVSEGAIIAQAFHRELGRLWHADSEAGEAWTGELGTLSLDLDPALDGVNLGHAIAREVRDRARDAQGPA